MLVEKSLFKSQNVKVKSLLEGNKRKGCLLETDLSFNLSASLQ